MQDWIALCRAELARGLLEDSAMTISQIAYAAGFGSTESLRRHFRAATGTSPRDYRQTFSAKAHMALLPAVWLRAGCAMTPSPPACPARNRIVQVTCRSSVVRQRARIR